MIDYQELERALQEMQPRQRLFELVKKEMLLRGRWRTKGRGKPFVLGKDKRRSKL